MMARSKATLASRRCSGFRPSQLRPVEALLQPNLSDAKWFVLAMLFSPFFSFYRFDCLFYIIFKSYFNDFPRIAVKAGHFARR